MTKKTKTYKSEDGTLELRVASDGSIAELLISGEAELINSLAVSELLDSADIKYGFQNAQKLCLDQDVKREAGSYFPIAAADDASLEPQVEILIEPLDCLLSQKLFSIKDLSRLRHIDAGEKIAKVKNSDSGSKSKNIFAHEIRDLSADKNFLQTYLGRNVEFDARRNAIISSAAGYALVENNKKISIIDNIILQQDIIETGFEIKTGLTLEGSIFSSDLVVNGDLVVKGKIENCNEKGIIVAGELQFESAIKSLLICKGSLYFTEEMEDCNVFCNSYVRGAEDSSIAGGCIQSGIAINSGIIGSEQAARTIAEISIAPFIKGMMIQICQELRKKDWNPAHPDSSDPLVKELEQLEIKFSKVIPDFISDNRQKNKITSNKGFLAGTRLRIFNLSWDINEPIGDKEFSLLQD
jgi:hypothetical protein